MKVKFMYRIFFTFLTVLMCFFAVPVFAQDIVDNRLTLTITPSLIKNNLSPGQVWKSYVKIVNHNKKEIEVNVRAEDFKAGTEGGTVDFLEKTEEDENNPLLLSNWIVLEEDSLVIPPGRSREVEFIIDVPKEASPGGHYAAIVIGTTPAEGEGEGASLKVSSQLASLMLINVAGDVIESGRIREFSSSKSIYTDSKVDLSVRFENTGNVHIQPQGEIRIIDMFGKTKDIIQLNHDTNSGNVLPEAIRRWDFEWESSGSILEMGRYTAELIVGYGEIAREHEDRVINFWIIFVKPLIYIISITVLLILLIVLFVRISIKRAVVQAQSSVIGKEVKKKKVVISNDVTRVVDLSDKVKKEEKKEDKKSKSSNLNNKSKKMIKWSFIKKLLLLIIAILLFLAGVFLYVYLNKYSMKQVKNKVMDDVMEPVIEEVEIIDDDKVTEVAESNEEKVASSSDSEMEDTDDEKTEEGIENDIEEEEVKINKKIDVKVLNGNGTSGVAGKAARLIKAEDYNSVDTGNADNYDYAQTVVRHKADNIKEAEEILLLFPDAMIEEDDLIESDVIVIVGSDFN